MSPYAGIVLAIMALLTGAGLMKLVRPAATAGALRAAHLPSSMATVRSLGVVEVSVGATGIITGSSASAAAGAVVYGAFALFVMYALGRALPISSCGCLGSADTPPSVIHVVLDLVAVAILVVAALSPIGPWGGLGEVSIGDALTSTLFTGVTVYLLYALIAVLPQPPPAAPRVNVPVSAARPARGE